VTECQGCGAWNDRSRTRCVLCGTPLGEIDEWEATDELPPLPPLPDGGLATTMPRWLRDLPAPTLPVEVPPEPVPELEAVPLPVPPRSLPPALPPLGAQVDPRTFLSEDDFPRWLHLLAAQRAARIPPVPPAAPVFAEPEPVSLPAALPQAVDVVWPSHVAPDLPAAATAPPIEAGVIPPPAEAATPEVVVLPPPGQPQRERSSWETLLLIALFIGLVVAAVWALVVNGVISPPVTP
jgi:hypothetical protein